MDIIHDQKLIKRKSGHGLEKLSPGNTTNVTDENEMAENLKSLPEFDYENPEMKAWMAQEEMRQRQSLAGMKREEVIAYVDQIARKGRAVKSKL